MKIKLLSVLSFADGVKAVGEVLEVPDPQGESLVSLGLATPAGKAPEAATHAHGHETAAHPRAEKR